MRITFVTSNAGKLDEARRHLGAVGVDVVASSAATTEVQADDLATVAIHKLKSLDPSITAPVFVEDAGLFVQSLGGFPGVYTAFALDTLGLTGLLSLLRDQNDRSAYFQAVIAYRDAGDVVQTFSGTIKGSIAPAAAGTGGFGFDPIFVPGGSDRTFAQMTSDDKNRLSHRGRALSALASHVAGSKENG